MYEQIDGALRQVLMVLVCPSRQASTTVNGSNLTRGTRSTNFPDAFTTRQMGKWVLEFLGAPQFGNVAPKQLETQSTLAFRAFKVRDEFGFGFKRAGSRSNDWFPFGCPLAFPKGHSTVQRHLVCISQSALAIVSMLMT